MAVPDPVLGHEPFAVLDDLRGSPPEGIRKHVISVLGEEYSLRGLASLKETGLHKFPVNATHKVMKLDVQEAVLNYINKSTSP